MMRESGFSIIELMVTLCVAAIAVTVAVPSFQTSLANNRLLTYSNELVVGLNFTRSEAIKRSTFVSICASTNQSTCTGSDWTQGWIIFVDSGTPGQVDGMDVILRSYANTNTDVSINLGGATYVRYAGAGFLAEQRIQPKKHWLTAVIEAVLPGGPAFASGVTPVPLTTQGSSITVCTTTGSATKGRAISISSSGRVTSTIVSCN